METIYQDGTYIEQNPTWHAEDSAWKARQILKMIRRNQLQLSTVCEIGCGAGEILNQLSEYLPAAIQFRGYEISSQAIALCEKRQKENLRFYLKDVLQDAEAYYDLAMAIDVLEHIEDCFGFLRKFRGTGRYKLFHIPLDLSVQTVLRSRPILYARQAVGHIHYFTKETALAALTDTGYKIIDHFYTATAVEQQTGWKKTALRWPRRILFWLHKDFAVRVLGGYSLLVLAE